jgi:hypothetical protein
VNDPGCSVRPHRQARTLAGVELLNFVAALALMGTGWFATVRILARTMSRGSGLAANGKRRSGLAANGKRPPTNGRARIRHFAASARHTSVR